MTGTHIEEVVLQTDIFTCQPRAPHQAVPMRRTYMTSAIYEDEVGCATDDGAPGKAASCRSWIVVGRTQGEWGRGCGLDTGKRVSMEGQTTERYMKQTYTGLVVGGFGLNEAGIHVLSVDEIVLTKEGSSDYKVQETPPEHVLT